MVNHNDKYRSTLQLTPRQIVEELDKYIISQYEAKRSVAVALRNRWRRMNVEDKFKDEIFPTNMLLIGPTGVGKTEISRRIAKLGNAPFLKVEASKFTEIGYVGRDVDSIVRDLMENGVNMVKKEMEQRISHLAKDKAINRILDILIKVQPTASQSKNNTSEDVSSNRERDESTRKYVMKKLRNGDLDDKEIDVQVKESSNNMIQMITPTGSGMEDIGQQMQDIFQNIVPKKIKNKRVKIAHAKSIFYEEELEKMIDKESIIQEALMRVQKHGIVFLDEVDKIISTQGHSNAEVSRQGVQRDLLPIIEGSTVNTKYGVVKTDHILFIASGAFHVAKPSDLIPEFQGRFPIRVELKPLLEDDFYRILTIPKNALIKQYQALMKADGVELNFTDEAIRYTAQLAHQVNEQVENIGARRLQTILSTVMEDYLFQVPDLYKKDSITIDKEYIQKVLSKIVQNQDLSHYIL